MSCLRGTKDVAGERPDERQGLESQVLLNSGGLATVSILRPPPLNVHSAGVRFSKPICFAVAVVAELDCTRRLTLQQSSRESNQHHAIRVRADFHRNTKAHPRAPAEVFD
ncbi:MAG: hypothetical protein ING67_08110 [Rhodocyclaceae bacterium]|nr:hypothetical protein [Rhodocyclaceae bacterium]